jgi:hypothetical protein
MLRHMLDAFKDHMRIIGERNILLVLHRSWGSEHKGISRLLQCLHQKQD